MKERILKGKWPVEIWDLWNKKSEIDPQADPASQLSVATADLVTAQSETQFSLSREMMVNGQNSWADNEKCSNKQLRL